jgi:hypothetical protein
VVAVPSFAKYNCWVYEYEEFDFRGLYVVVVEDVPTVTVCPSAIPEINKLNIKQQIRICIYKLQN